MSWRATFLLLAVLSLAAAKYRRYDGHRVYRVVPSKGHHLDLLNKLAHENKKEITFWKAAYVTNKPADVMVSPQVKNSFLAALKKNGVKYSVLVEDVQKLIDKQRPTGAAGGKFSWDDYYPLEDVYKWIKSLPAKYPGIVTTVVGGYSYENREIVGVNISFGTNRPIVVLEGTIHAREWISTAAVTWMLNQILTSTNSTVRSIVDQFNYYILPVYNPDGYKYTFTDDRMWRKTLQPHLPCMGADPNRNWDHRWAEEGASNNPCDGKYHGPRAFSEIEIRTVSKFLASLGRDLQLYMAFHSYSQLLMYPYGSSHEVADNDAELNKIAGKAVKAVTSRHGTHYEFGTIAKTIYPATGGSPDWVKGKLKVPYSFVWELRDYGKYGFLLPKEQIIPTSEETFEGVLSILEDVWAAIRC